MCNDLCSSETIALRCRIDRKDVLEHVPGLDDEDDEWRVPLHHEKEASANMIEEQKQRKETIATLLHQTAEDHHVAYKETDGVDPDWSIWYAGHLLENGFETLLDARLLKSDLIYLLVLVDKQQMSEAPGAHWEKYYADFFVNRYLKE
jgi:hypothetical protein